MTNGRDAQFDKESFDASMPAPLRNYTKETIQGTVEVACQFRDLFSQELRELLAEVEREEFAGARGLPPSAYIPQVILAGGLVRDYAMTYVYEAEQPSPYASGDIDLCIIGMYDVANYLLEPHQLVKEVLGRMHEKYEQFNTFYMHSVEEASATSAIGTRVITVPQARIFWLDEHGNESEHEVDFLVMGDKIATAYDCVSSFDSALNRFWIPVASRIAHSLEESLSERFTYQVFPHEGFNPVRAQRMWQIHAHYLPYILRINEQRKSPVKRPAAVEGTGNPYSNIND